MDASAFARARRWLLSSVVTLLLVLAFAAVDRARRSTVEGKFNYIHLGMEQKRVHDVLGPGKKSGSVPGQVPSDEWSLEGYTIGIGFDEAKRVISKSIRGAP